MKVSIITVCKNAKDTIKSMFESIQGQSYENIEHIVIDGVSSDGTLDIIKNYTPDVLVSEADSGIYNAMNKGISLAQGDVLYFLNANDSFFSGDVIENIVSEFINKKADMVYGDINLVNEGKYSLKKFNKSRAYYNVLNHAICHQAIFYKKRLFDEIGVFDESFKISADNDFNQKVLKDKKYRVSYLNEVVANYDLTGISSSDSTNHIRQAENKRIFQSYVKNKFEYLRRCCELDAFYFFNANKFYSYLMRYEDLMR